MSDGATPLADSGSPAPRSSTEIAASVIQDAEHADTATPETTTRVDTTNLVEETPSPQPKTEPTATELSAAAKFLLKQGHKMKKDDGRDVWLPAKTVEGMLDRYVGEHRTTWDGERTTLSTKAQKAEELQGAIDQLRAGVGGDPKAFLSELAEIDPRYAAFLEQKAAAATVSEDMPPLDYPLPDGSRTYSADAIQTKLIPWLTQVIGKQLEGTIDARFKPIAEREKAAQAQQQREAQQAQIHQTTQAQMQDAQTWPLFGKLAEDGSLTEFQQSVLDELVKDTAEAKTKGTAPKLTMEGAYIRASNKRYLEDDATKRARLLKEIADAPKSSALSRQTTDAPKTIGPRSTQDIVRATIAKLESQG